MGQISNILTLRQQQKNLDLLSAESKSFLYSLNFINTLKRSLSKKGVLTLESSSNSLTNVSFLHLKLFFQSVKTKNYKLGFSSLKNKRRIKVYQNLRVDKLFFNQFKLLKRTITVLTVKNLNKEIDSKIVKRLYNSFKRFTNMLFSRRFNLFVDFLKLTSLFIKGKVLAHNFLYLLSQVFRLLTKKKHSRFMYFLKYLFIYIVKTESQSNSNLIRGVKIIINGKILGKPRSSSSRLLIGSVPIQTIKANINFSKTHVYTLYGVFGFKLWVHYS